MSRLLKKTTPWVTPAVCEGAANGDGPLHPQMPQQSLNGMKKMFFFYAFMGHFRKNGGC